MMASNLSRIHVLVLRDELPAIGQEGTERDPAGELLPPDARLRVTLAKAAYGEGLRAARQHHPDVIVLDGVLGDPVVLVAELDEALQRTPLLVILDQAERERAHDCVVAGARGCLVRPIDPNTLVRTIVQLHEKAARRRKQLQASTEKGARVIAVRGAKGGVGSSVLATNLAVAIRRLTRQRVVLVDGHFFGGDVAVMLDLVPDRSLADLIAHLQNLDDELVASSLVDHSSGLGVRAAPAELERAEAITAEELQRVLEALRTRYDFVVVDTAPFLDQNSLVVLDMADLLLLVSTPEIPALKNAARFLQLGADFGYSEQKMRLIINRANGPGRIAPDDYEKYLEYRTSFSIPDDTSAVVDAMTRGQPLVTYRPSTRAARALNRLARTVVADQGWEAEPARRRADSRLRLPMPSLSVPGLGLGRRNREEPDAATNF